MKKNSLFLLFSFLLFSCAPAIQTPSQIISVYATSAAEPWLVELFACANEISAVLKVNAESPEIYLRLGEPEIIISPVYQIGEEEILVVTQRESSVQKLTLTETQELFAQGSPAGSAQVWGYASGADVQIMFEQLVMKGRSVTSSARIAASPQNMSAVLNSESAAIGILPRQWLTNDLRVVYSAGTVPVLAITKEDAAGQVESLLSCLSD
jgi:hypothetical protein